MKERDCKSCLFNSGDGCMSWDCEYINRDEAAEAYRKQKAEEAKGTDCAWREAEL